MAASRWIFTKEQLLNTPSRKCGIDADKELSYRQQAATLIQDMGQRLSVAQLCINTAIVYMHRFYMFQSFTRFPRNEMAPACLFLAAKVEEQPRKLEHVIKVAHSCLHRDNTPAPDVKSEAYLEQAQVLVINENILLQTLGFDVTVDHPHTNVIKLTQLVKASKDLSQTSYFLATNSLHMTTFCLQYRPTVVACVCIYLACKWSNWKLRGNKAADRMDKFEGNPSFQWIPRSNEGKEWFQYIDRSVTQEMLEERYKEFLDILEKYPHKLRKKIMGWKGERTEGITKEDLEPSPSPSTSSRHEHRKETVSDHRKEHQDRKESSKGDSISKRDTSHHGEQKERSGTEHRQVRPGVPERKEDHLHPDRKEQSHNRDSVRHRDVVDGSDKSRSLDRKNIPHVKSSTESAVDNRSHVNQIGKSDQSGSDIISSDMSGGKAGSVNSVDASAPSSSFPKPNVISEMHRSKSETTLNYKDYLKRKEQERLEKEKALKMKLAAESEALNKSFSEGHGKPEKIRPPKLNISSNNHSEMTNSNSTGSERPYEVNIKSPIKPHHKIKVKSPIKSSDLKQPKLEITKFQITPEKDGSDPISVNINNDPNLKKIMENTTKEQGATPQDSQAESSEGNFSHSNHDRTDSPRVKLRHESVSPRTKIKQEATGSPRIKLKLDPHDTGIKVFQDTVDRLKDKPNTLDSPSDEIQLRPEHTVAPNVKIRELNYDPDKSNDSTSLKQSFRQESGSGRSTPVVSHIKSESSSSASPLKLKIITKGLKTDGEHSSSSSQHGSPHSRHHKHRHKSHKHSKDKHKERRHEHRDNKEGTNGHSLKMSIKLSSIPGGDPKYKHDKHKISLSDTSLNKNSNSSDFNERQQPWSMSDLMSQAGSNQEVSRKRRRTPTVDPNVDINSHSKQAKVEGNVTSHHRQAKVETNRLRRSSSSHSVVSMEMSDGEIDERTSNGPGKLEQPKIMVNQLHESLQQAIDQTKRSVRALQQRKQRQVTGVHGQVSTDHPSIDRQQSGFDLEGMMWSCGSSDPPLPTETPPPLPMSPPPHVVPPPPPPP